MGNMLHGVWISAPISKVFHALTTVEGLAGWWTIHTKKEKDEITFGFNNSQYWFKFKVVKQSPDKIEWNCVKADEQSVDWPNTVISWKLSDEGEQTHVLMKHDNWNENSSMFPICNSTWGHLMYSLKNFVENGKGEPMR